MIRSLCQGSVLAALLLAPLAAQDGTDTCVTPTAIGEGSFAYDTSTMVTSQDLSEGSCGLLDFHQDMFWVYTATVAGDLTVESSSANFDTQLAGLRRRRLHRDLHPSKRRHRLADQLQQPRDRAGGPGRRYLRDSDRWLAL